MHCTVRKQGDLCVYSGKVPFRMDEESMVQRLTRIKELNGKLSRPPHYAHGTSAVGTILILRHQIDWLGGLWNGNFY